MNYKELQAYAEFKDVHLKVWSVVYFGTHGRSLFHLAESIGYCEEGRLGMRSSR